MADYNGSHIWIKLVKINAYRIKIRIWNAKSNWSWSWLSTAHHMQLDKLNRLQSLEWCLRRIKQSISLISKITIMRRNLITKKWLKKKRECLKGAKNSPGNNKWLPGLVINSQSISASFSTKVSFHVQKRLNKKEIFFWRFKFRTQVATALLFFVCV